MPFLILQDGTAFEGESFGAWSQKEEKELRVGEVVFNTSMTGYQEMVTDLSYAGQILVLTHPQIGNYGWHDEENEADKILLKGLVVRELSGGEGSEHADRSLEEFCKMHSIWGIKGIDTRALTRLIREHGVLRGVLTTNIDNLQALVNELKNWEVPQDVVAQVSTKEPYILPPAPSQSFDNSEFHVVVMDFGIKGNILRTMQEEGYSLTVVPYSTSAKEILELKPDGVFLSNGPGDPKVVISGIEAIRELVKHLPVFGICLGHQLLTLALGGDTYKLKYGHRGGNQAVQDLRTEKVTITSQNHGYSVEETSLENTTLEVTHRNLNDRTVEGVRHTELPVFSVQYHPEAGPGPNDSLYLFKEFTASMAERRASHAS